MSQKFVKGYTNNHLTFVMVDATDFATPESALSAATKIKIYGKVKGATGVNLVSSGTGSLTNDIQHVGASALGIYTIALAKADLSDASAAWYDQYVVSLSATGAAYQTLIIDGGILESYLSAALSDTLSGVVALSDAISNVHSELTSQFAVVSNYLSNASNFQSDILSTVGSQYSDLASKIGGITAAVSASDISDIASAVWATALATKLVQLNTSDLSDLRSAISAGPAGAVTASDISDIASAVKAALASDISDIYSAAIVAASYASDAHSQALLASSRASDAASGVTVLLSRITETAATSSDLVSKIWSDFESKMGASPSQLYSVLLLAGSRVSDVQSYLVGMSGMLSDTHSAAAATGATASAIADKVWSDFGSKAGATPSQLYSVALIGASAASDAASAAQQANSRVILVQSRLSDLDSRLASDVSDIMSNIDAVAATVSASDISDIASAVNAILASNLSDILSAAQQANSRVLVVQSLASDAHSAALLAASAASDTYSAITANRAEPAQGAPGASITALAKLDYLYKAWRNRTTQTATQYSLYNDDAVTVDHKATFSDDGTTADRAEVATGP